MKRLNTGIARLSVFGWLTSCGIFGGNGSDDQNSRQRSILNGDVASLAHCKPGLACRISPFDKSHYYTLRGRSSNDVWTVDRQSNILYQWNGATWLQNNSLVEADIEGSVYDIAFPADGSLWVNATGTLYRFDGQSWVRDTPEALQVDEFEAVGNAIIALISDHTAQNQHKIAIRDNGVWTQIDVDSTSTAIREMVAFSASDIWLGERSRGVLHWDGAAWQRFEEFETRQANRIVGSSSNNISFFTNDGIIKWDGEQMLPVMSQFPEAAPSDVEIESEVSDPDVINLRGFDHGFSVGNSVYALANTTLLVISESGIREIEAPAVFNVGWGANENDVWFLDTSHPGSLYHWNGSEFYFSYNRSFMTDQIAVDGDGFLLRSQERMQRLTGARVLDETVVKSKRFHRSPEGTLWYFDDSALYQREGQDWTSLVDANFSQGAAVINVMAGSDESLLVATQETSTKTCAPRTIWYLPGPCSAVTLSRLFQRANGSFTEIATYPTGIASLQAVGDSSIWGLSQAGEIFRLELKNDTWQLREVPMPDVTQLRLASLHARSDQDVMAVGFVVVGAPEIPSESYVYQWNGSEWQRQLENETNLVFDIQGFGSERIAIGQNFSYRFDGTGWLRINFFYGASAGYGEIVDVDQSSDGIYWFADRNGAIWRFDPTERPDGGSQENPFPL